MTHTLKNLNRFILNIFCICIIVLISCNNSEQKAKEEETITDDSLQAVQSIRSEDSLMIFNNGTSWINRSVQQANIDWNRFHLTEFWNDDSLQQKSFRPGKEFYKDYAP